jgi:recombination protein RecT
VPGWQGVVDLINRSGRGVVRTGAVYNGDFFEWELGLEPFLRHKNTGVETADNLIFTYAIGQIRGEGGWTPPPIIEVWSADKLRFHLETYNKVGTSHYALASGNNWIMYARKIPLLQVAKYMPKSAEISRAIEAANRADSGEAMTIDGDFNFTDDPAAGAPPPPAATGGSSGGAPKPETFEQLRDRIDASANRDAADLILDAARHLPAERIKELAGMADKKHPRG